MNLNESYILGLGSPLLDLSANVDKEFLRKYDLQSNNVIRPEEKHRTLVQDMAAHYPVEMIAGGAVQNTIRVAQWFFSQPRVATIFGTVGDDNFAQQMRTKAEEDRVLVAYLTDYSNPTGTCACLITNRGKDRSLVAFLDASQHFSRHFLEENFRLVEKARIIYTSGFFLTVNFEAQLLLARHVHSLPVGRKLFTFNLSAPFLATRCKSELRQILPYVDILFGNEAEALAVAEMQGWNTKDVAQIAQLLADSAYKRPRTVIITQGGDDVLVAFSDSPTEFRRFPVNSLSEEEILDTNGAGDAFVGGFLAYRALDKPLKLCIEVAIYAATEVIKRSGCAFPPENKFRV